MKCFSGDSCFFLGTGFANVQPIFFISFEDRQGIQRD